MEHETSKFESSEMLATFIASTPLLEESWRLCSHANAVAHKSFVVNRVGEVAYVAFSGVQMVAAGSDENCRNLVEIEDFAKGIFTSFSSLRVEGGEPVRVHGGLLQLFLSFYNCHNFQQQIFEMMNESKSVVFTGHSIGGAIASLSALWLLSNIQTASSSSVAVFCITYGSPMLGNGSFAQAILQGRWAGNFCHVVAQHDLVPRLLFAPSSPFVPQLHSLLQFWHLSMTSPYFGQLAFQIPDEKKEELFNTVLAGVEVRSREIEDQERTSSFCPFGSYMFCSENGAVCLDNAMAIIKLLYLMLSNGSVTSSIEDHLKYEDCVRKICRQYLLKTSFKDVCFSESSNEAGIALALKSAGIHQEPAYGVAKSCLMKSRQLGCIRNLNNAKMAVALAKINPLRAQIEWYKKFCDDSDDKLGYYDAFKRRSASKRDSKVNLNRHKLGQFWDELIEKLETNKLTHDFHKLSKYVNASQFYKLLVEPLEIAEYYRHGEHKKKGHYIEHGREKRFKIFDKWWRDRKVGDEENNPRSKFASLTQDSCFWARVEEARDSIYEVRGETDTRIRLLMLEKIEKFEQYASRMINRKEVSIDVLAKNSSYNMFIEDWRELKSQLQLLPPHFPGFQDRMVQ